MYMQTLLQLTEYKQIHTKADCCRYNGAKVPWYGTTWVTDNGYADTPAYCQYICDWSPGCLYYSHSTRWKNCVLCSKCDFVTKNNGWRYTSWERVKGMFYLNRVIAIAFPLHY